ncbi:unnamed protein product [Rhizophagus irregularis]|nr:unnamed protein product [Rhizophagus irregularis]
MTESEKSEEIESRNIPTDNKKIKPTKSTKRKPKNKGGETEDKGGPEDKGGKTKKIEILLGKIFHRPHKKLPRSVKPPSQSLFKPINTIKKVSKNFANFKNDVDTAAANANSSGTGVQNLQYS